MTDVAAATYSAVTNILECDGTPTINEGMFVVEDASGTDTTDRVVIQAAGFYQLIVSLHIDSIASTLRTVAIVSFQLERGGTDTVLADQGTEYVRDGVEAASVYHTSLVELEVDDRIGVVLQSEAGSASIGIDGSKSYFAIIRTGGPEGPRGPAGTGSDIDSVDVSYAPDVRSVGAHHRADRRRCHLHRVDHHPDRHASHLRADRNGEWTRSRSRLGDQPRSRTEHDYSS